VPLPRSIATGSPRAFASGASGGVERLLELRDQVFEVVRLLRQIGGARSLGGERFLALGFLLLPFPDQRAHASALAFERGHLALEPVAFVGDFLAHFKQRAQIAGERLNLMAHFRQHGAEQHGRAHRLQGVFGAGDQGRGSTVADALQRRQDLADHGTASVE